MLMRSSRTFVWSATAFGLVVLFWFFVAIGYDFYRGTLAMSQQVATNVAALTGQDISRNVELYDLSIQSVVEGASDPDILYQEPGLRQKILFDKAATAPGLGAIVAIDKKGDIFLDSWSVQPREGNFADRDYFIAHRDADHDLGLYVSRPFEARLQGRTPSVSLSRRINNPDGSFGGLVSGTIRLAYFERLFDKVSLDFADTITLLREDGTLMVHNGAVVADVGADWRSAPVFKHLAGLTHGSFISDASKDGVNRLFAFQRIDNVPLILVVGLSTQHILAPWWSKMLVFAGIFAVMALGVVALVWLLEKELLRRAAAEEAAEELARTDGLTKLANRRWFDEELERTWAVAIRRGQPISLLMIDVDYFKHFNDSHGHQEGDHVLEAVAKVIQASVRRPDDTAARYGGEEFVALLPDTDEAGANQIAMTICDGVRRLQIKHDLSEHRSVTVSIGAATVLPQSGTDPSALIHDADIALYLAKDAGRNTIRFHNIVCADFGAQMSRAS
jgi:diguanylate cyclase (GGDEF)-like protein